MVVVPVPIGRRAAAGVVVPGVACGVRRDGLRQGDAEVALDVLVDLEDGDVDDDFGAGTVEVVQQLLREEQLVRRGAHDDGVLAGDERRS